MKMIVVSNMYPDEAHPSYGIFVKRFCDILDQLNISYKKIVMFKGDSTAQKTKGYLRFYTETFFKLLFFQYDIVYIHYASHSGIPVLIADKFKKMNIYTNVHGSDVAPENVVQEKMQWVTKRLLDKSKKIVVPSEYFKKYVANKYELNKERFYVFPSAGIDNTVFHKFSDPIIDNVKKRYGVNNDLMCFGMAGRISPDKGWDTFVEAIKLVLDAKFMANFLIVGDGIESEKLDKKIAENNLLDNIIRIKLLPQNELAQYYAMLDYFVFPTKREGESLGLVALEALSCGTPVIASDFAAPKYYIEDNINGYKFEMGRAGALAKLMIDRIKKGRDYEYLKRGALRTAQKFELKMIKMDLKSILMS